LLAITTSFSDLQLPSTELESPKLSIEELIRSDRVLSVRLNTTPGSNFSDHTNERRRPFSSPPRSNSFNERIKEENQPEENEAEETITASSSSLIIPETSSLVMTDNYLMTIPSVDEITEEESSERINPNSDHDHIPLPPRPPPRTVKVISVPLERISMEWTIEDMKYCPASIEVNDYRRSTFLLPSSLFFRPFTFFTPRGRSRRIAYIISRENTPSRLRSYMQLAEYIPLLMMDDAESQCGRFSSTEIRRRQLSLSLKKVSLLSQNDHKIESIWNSLFTQANDLDENFLKKVGAPKHRMNSSRFSSYETFDYGSTNTAMTMNRYNSDDHLFDQTNRSSSPTLTSLLSSSSSTSIRMEGSVAVCTGRRSWSEEWAILTGQYFSIPNPQTSKHLRSPYSPPLLSSPTTGFR
jgi:hypothetical protein